MTIPYLHAAETKLLLQVKSDLDRHEGFREYAYPDPLSELRRKFPHLAWGFKPARSLVPMGTNLDTGAPWTYGFGETNGVGPDSRITRILAERKLEMSILEIDNALRNILSWYDGASFVTKTVLINMAYNMGLKSLLGFKNSLAMLGAKRYQDAAHNLTLSLWYKQVGNRAKELVHRIATQTIEPQNKAPEKIC